MIIAAVLIIGISILIYNNYVDLNIYSASDSSERRRYKRHVASYVTFLIGVLLIIFWLLDYLMNNSYITISDDVFIGIIIAIFVTVGVGFLFLIRRKHS